MEPLQPSDSALIALYLAGREAAFAQLLQRHQARVYTTIHLVVRDEDLARLSPRSLRAHRPFGQVHLSPPGRSGAQRATQPAKTNGSNPDGNLE